MDWSVVPFGVHNGKILPQIVFQDPDWFFWASENNVFKEPLAAEARIVYARARHIRVPQKNDDEQLVVEYAMRRRGGKFCGIELVPQRQAHHTGTPTIRSSTIDLGYPRSCSTYDKSGGRRMVREVKRIFFGSTSARVTAERAAAFFDDEANFDLSLYDGTGMAQLRPVG